MGLRSIILCHVLIFVFISCEDRKIQQINHKEEDIPVREFAFKELSPCENAVLNHLLNKDVEKLIPYLSERFIHIDAPGSSVEKRKLINQLRAKKGFWYELLITAKQPHQFEYKDSPNLSIPEYSVSDMLGRRYINFDYINPDEPNYRNVITSYKDYKKDYNKGESQYYYYIKFEVFDDKRCKFYGVGIARNIYTLPAQTIAAEILRTTKKAKIGAKSVVG
ncbi:hypothetical protein [Leptospira ilyithenensis]|uniref:hypothetical protein n=1 Tax=Leptospira ilyithenensis TaxID=2484901 RepID=UPI00143828C9|nr:hypothetical protein [Leptospira ilyithenensis]